MTKSVKDKFDSRGWDALSKLMKLTEPNDKLFLSDLWTKQFQRHFVDAALIPAIWFNMLKSIYLNLSFVTITIIIEKSYQLENRNQILAGV